MRGRAEVFALQSLNFFKFRISGSRVEAAKQTDRRRHNIGIISFTNVKRYKKLALSSWEILILHWRSTYIVLNIGEEALDTDVPTELEGRLFTTPFRKFIWLVLQPLFYAFRPLIIYKKAPTDLELLNALVQVSSFALKEKPPGFICKHHHLITSLALIPFNRYNK